MSVPTVSVLMPVYNAERYVAEAVESILAQTFKDFEFVIIDDGSTDGSRAILEGYAKQDSRIRLVSRPNTGYVVALNEMLSLASGELIARMDADDAALPARFARQVEYLLEHAEYVAVGCQILLVDPDGDPLREVELKLNHADIVRVFLESGFGIGHPCAMIRREALDTIGGYREDLETAEDLDLFLRLADIGQLANLPDVLLRYRLHREKVSVRAWRRQYDTHCAIITSHRSRLGLPSLEKLPPPRPPSSVCEEYRTWAWWALLKARNSKTARKNAFRALRLEPFSLASWRVLACAIRGY